jgi:hypothetical protein
MAGTSPAISILSFGLIYFCAAAAAVTDCAV